MADFKLSVLWNVWTPQIQSRVMRDVLALQSRASKSRTTLVVACDAILRSHITSLGVQATEDFTNPDMCRVYVVNGIDIPEDLYPRLPDNVEPMVVSLTGEAIPQNQLTVEEDPYAGVEFFKDGIRIPETMPLDKPPPNGHRKGEEPPYSPYL